MADARTSALLSANASDEARALVRLNMSRIRPEGYAQAARMLANGHLIGDATGYDGPVLVLCGSEDAVTSEAGCKQVAQAYTHVRYETLPGVGHASYVENGPQFNDAVMRFLGALDD